MKVFHNRSEFQGSCYFEIQPGPPKMTCWNEGSIYVDSDEWEIYVEPLLVWRIDEYSRFDIVEVPRSVWLAYLNDLDHLITMIFQCDLLGELQVEMPWLGKYWPFESEHHYQAQKAELRAFYVDLHHWISETVVAHESISIHGL